MTIKQPQTFVKQHTRDSDESVGEEGWVKNGPQFDTDREHRSLHSVCGFIQPHHKREPIQSVNLPELFRIFADLLIVRLIGIL